MKKSLKYFMKEIIKSYWGLIMLFLSCLFLLLTYDVHPLLSLFVLPFWCILGSDETN